MVEIKFCGMTRPEDARDAAALGARYIGVILAEGPRTLTNDAARAIFAVVPAGISRVGVFGAAPPEQIADRAQHLGLDIVQLHGDPDARTIAQLRTIYRGQVWAVQRIAGADIPELATALFDVADGVVLDARVAGKLGGTGVTLAWDEIAARIKHLRQRRARLVLAGGLRPENVAKAIDALQPDIVDVSSGVEARMGVKDADRMRAFRDAVLAVPTR